MGLFSKKGSGPASSAASEASPVVSAADLTAAAQLMDLWDSSMGNNDAMYDCQERIARLGGFRGGEAFITELAGGGDAEHVMQRPWRWWAEAARVATASGDDVLTGRIFLFAYLFKSKIAPMIRPADFVDVGLTSPSRTSYQSIAACALDSLGRLAPDYLIHDTATGRVDVATAAELAQGALEETE
jgi:hypothetical protein